jgi:hypothetical protein
LAKLKRAARGSPASCTGVPAAAHLMRTVQQNRKIAGSKPNSVIMLPAVLQLPVEGAKQTSGVDQYT